jgi:hypothetical protein
MVHVFDDILRVALAAARPWGFALGGSRALVLHGVIDRPAQDTDLFTPHEDVVREAAAAVVTALREAGFEAAEVEVESDLAGLIEGLDTAMVELEVTAANGSVTAVSLGIQPRRHDPVELAVGPVLHVEDLAASKMSAMANGAQITDFMDIAALQAQFGRPRLLELAASVDPGLTAEDYAWAVRQLDLVSDAQLVRYGADPRAVRRAFAIWPR